jgi:hypothetical protein
LEATGIYWKPVWAALEWRARMHAQLASIGTEQAEPTDDNGIIEDLADPDASTPGLIE